MAISKEKNRTYTVHLKYRDALTGKVKWKKKRGFKTQREAKLYEADLIRRLETPSTLTFHKLADLWDDHNEVSAVTKQKHEEHFRLRFGDLYDEPIESLSKQRLALWRAELASDDRFSTTTKNQTLSFVRSVFRFAHEVYDIPNNAMVLKTFKKTDDEIMSAGMQVWTPEEFEAFNAAVPSPLYQAFFELLYWTGMRRGEAIALQKSDYEDGWINIQYSQRTRKEGLKPTKTKQRRRIQVDDKLKATLDALPFDHGYLFGGDTPMGATSLRRYFNMGIEGSGVKPIRMHDLRHSHATWLINNGVNIVAVSKRLGHENIQTTLTTYTHLLAKTDNAMMAKINKQRKSCPKVARAHKKPR